MNSELLNPQLDYRYRDFWGEYLPIALERHRPVLESTCHSIRYYRAPSAAQESILSVGYLKVVLQIPPGSFILGTQTQTTAITDPYVVQVSDVGLNHRLFSQPVPINFLTKNERNTNFFHTPHPVTPPGLIVVEFWNRGADTQVCSLTLAVAEIDPAKEVS